MSSELLADASATEIASMLLLIAGMGFMLLIPFVWIVSRILFLTERPDQRAFRTTGVAYVVAALISIFGFGDFLPAWLGPIVPMLGAIAIFFWLRTDYRKGWVEDHEITEEMTLENSDWRIGVGLVVAVIVAAAVKVLVLRG